MELLPSLFSCVYSRVKLFVFAMNSRRRYSIFVCFILRTKEKNSKSKVIFAVCRQPITSCLTSLMTIDVSTKVVIHVHPVVRSIILTASRVLNEPSAIC